MIKNNVINIDELINWDILLQDEEKIIQRSIKKFVDSTCMPKITENFMNGKISTNIIKSISNLGILGGDIKGYGCPNLTSIGYGLACYELESCDSGLRTFVSTQTSLAMYAIYRFGNEDQKKKWLPLMSKGLIIGCFALTEPNHGSDPSSMTSIAQKNGNNWIISGTKTWITNATIADIIIFWCKKNNQTKSINAFIIETTKNGIIRKNIPNKLSLRTSITGTIYLNNVNVENSNRLPFADGLESALICLNNARFSVGFGVLGAAHACLEYTIKYTINRVQFGKPIATKQLIQDKIAIMGSELIKGILLAIHCGRLKSHNKLTNVQISLMKKNNCRTALDIARISRAILGANGIIADYHIIRHMLNLESILTCDGTEEMHSLVIGKALTGKDAIN